MDDASGGWLALPYAEWRDTRDTLHMYAQVIGKLRLALSPFEPGWANVPLYVTARGLTTSPLPIGLRTFDAELDLRDHVLVIRTSDGQMERRPLGGAVADFYRDVMDALRRMGIDVAISVHPSEVPDPIPFPDDHTHVTYDRAQVLRFQHVLSMIDMVMKEHRARFRGRTTPVQFFWGTFDLALTRYSGKLVEPLPGDSVIAHFGSDAEEVCAGWWPGDHRVPSATFFSYAYPAPPDISAVTVRPTGAAWSPDAGEFLFPYEAALATADPRRAIRDFLASSYDGAARLMGWSSDLTTFSEPDAPATDHALRRAP
ncbi:MAG: DUF5996 family protein [Candidatus Dormiibacterota bacterium]